MFIDYDLVRRMKEQYPPGTRIQLDYIIEAITPVPARHLSLSKSP